MNLLRIRKKLTTCSLILLGTFGFACTGILVKTEDGVAIPARTMEFGFDIESKLIVVPSGTEIKSLTSVEGKTGLVYNTKYGFTGMNGVDKPVIFDGVNEKGLYFGAFYFSGEAKFEEITSKNIKKAVSSEELGNWILGNFSNVEEVKSNLKNISVVASYIDVIKGFAPFHYYVTDKNGESIIIEYTSYGLHVYDNEVGVICNNPKYNWHLTNLRNYVGLGAKNRTKIDLTGGYQIDPFGQGTGLLGMPGDYTSPSRFVRATAFVNTILPSKNTYEGIFNAFHLLNNFDIPKGAIRDDHGMDYTVWTSATDTKTSTYYFKSYINQKVNKIDLHKALKKYKKIKVIDFEKPQEFYDIMES